MSHTAIITFRNEGDEPVCCVCKHGSGYIDGLGHSLAKWLKRMTILNGMWSEEQHREHDYANGIGCLAAKWIADNKTETGVICMCASDRREAYNYDIILHRYRMRLLDMSGTKADDCITITVLNKKGNLIFSGSPSELLEFEEAVPDD